MQAFIKRTSYSRAHRDVGHVLRRDENVLREPADRERESVACYLCPDLNRGTHLHALGSLGGVDLQSAFPNVVERDEHSSRDRHSSPISHHHLHGDLAVHRIHEHIKLVQAPNGTADSFPKREQQANCRE